MSDESYLIRQERCPLCAAEGRDRTGNNLAVYSDGHSFCYSGHGIVTKGNKLVQFLNTALPLVKDEVVLPLDSDMNYPKKCLEWVGHYELDENDLLTNNVLWSESMQRLIFPVYDGEKGVIAWQGRWFGDGDRPKWFGRGKLHECVNILGTGDKLVFTEDIVSAIKVAKCGVQAMPIYGCVIGRKMFKRLMSMYEYNHRMIVWLDPDKAKESLREARLGGVYGFNVSARFTAKDPKEIPIEDIKEMMK